MKLHSNRFKFEYEVCASAEHFKLALRTYASLCCGSACTIMHYCGFGLAEALFNFAALSSELGLHYPVGRCLLAGVVGCPFQSELKVPMRNAQAARGYSGGAF